MDFNQLKVWYSPFSPVKEQYEANEVIHLLTQCSPESFLSFACNTRELLFILPILLMLEQCYRRDFKNSISCQIQIPTFIGLLKISFSIGCTSCQGSSPGLKSLVTDLVVDRERVFGGRINREISYLNNLYVAHVLHPRIPTPLGR